MIFGIDRQSPSHEAIVDDKGIRLTYGELAGFIREMAGCLGERELAFCLCDNSAGALAGFLALYDHKVVCLLLNAAIDPDLLRALDDTYRPSYYWLPDGKAGDRESVFSAFGYRLCRTGREVSGMHPDLSMLMTTSGTTGSPKLVRHKYGNIEDNARNVASVFGWQPDDRGICDLPMQYTMGLNVINSHLYAGSTVLMVSENLMSPKFWSFIKTEKGTDFTGVPYSYEILNRLRFTRMDLPHLRTFAEGGGKLSDALFQWISSYAEQSGKRFFATFGTTETSARLAFLPPEMAVSKTGSIGKAIPEGRLYIVDDAGCEIPVPDVEGELVYEGPNVTMGYAECLEDLLLGDVLRGVYHTGDIAVRDSDGCFYIAGRKKRFLKLFGLRISLDQSERIISESMGIECACTGDDAQMRIFVTDEKVKDEVKRLIAEKTGLISSSFVVHVVEAFPRLESGKIDYRSLKNLI